MEPKIKVNKLLFALKTFLFTAIFIIASSAHAEYYLVYSGPGATGCGYGCRVKCCSSFRFVSHYRHFVHGGEEESEYEWVGDP